MMGSESLVGVGSPNPVIDFAYKSCIGQGDLASTPLRIIGQGDLAPTPLRIIGQGDLAPTSNSHFAI
ncbi:MAG: hypothetical protein RLZZ435_3846 [Cyanobacteriota bacterium]|jgi:hypothetical protein